jgi:hypothetical protein
MPLLSACRPVQPVGSVARDMPGPITLAAADRTPAHAADRERWSMTLAAPADSVLLFSARMLMRMHGQNCQFGRQYPTDLTFTLGEAAPWLYGVTTPGKEGAGKRGSDEHRRFRSAVPSVGEGASALRRAWAAPTGAGRRRRPLPNVVHLTNAGPPAASCSPERARCSCRFLRTALFSRRA